MLYEGHYNNGTIGSTEQKGAVYETDGRNKSSRVA